MSNQGQPALDLARTFAEVARAIAPDGGLDAALKRIAEIAARVIEPCDHAGVSVVQRGEVRTWAASGEATMRVDAIQYELDEGPCLDAIRKEEITQVDELATETRWPRFVARASRETDVAASVGYRLFVDGRTLGALNLYATRPGAFSGDEEACELGAILAAHAAVAVGAALAEEQMQEALRSRDVIGQAKGIIMATRRVDEDEAFAILRRASQRLNVKVRDLAEKVAFTGATPDDDSR